MEPKRCPVGLSSRNARGRLGTQFGVTKAYLPYPLTFKYLTRLCARKGRAVFNRYAHSAGPGLLFGLLCVWVVGWLGGWLVVWFGVWVVGWLSGWVSGGWDFQQFS